MSQLELCKKEIYCRFSLKISWFTPSIKQVVVIIPTNVVVVGIK